jgi:hypothetical protein
MFAGLVRASFSRWFNSSTGKFSLDIIAGLEVLTAVVMFPSSGI